jgi:hypothetical protein
LAGFNLRNTPVNLSFPRFCSRWFNTAVSRNHDTVNEFRDNFRRHFACFFNDLIKRDRHGVNLTVPPFESNFSFAHFFFRTDLLF